MPLKYEGKADIENTETESPTSYVSSRNFLGEKEDMNHQVEILSVKHNQIGEKGKIT